MTPPLTVTEDTPADMLAGNMDLDVILPTGELMRTSVLRSTPMMDLLIQITTARRLNPGNFSLQAMGERGIIQYKPSTPIGLLDAFTVRVTEKKSTNPKRAPPIPVMMPNTFRLQVHLPRSQLFVTRVSPEVTVGEVFSHVCKEKDLDPEKYELRNTANLSQTLESRETLGQTQQLTLVVRGTHPTRQLSSADIIHVKQSNIRGKSICDSSLSSDSLGSRSVSPVAMSAPPQVPQRKKRRPAPKPPVFESQQSRPVMISHSRESSDSSGYHEPSTLSESPTHGPRLVGRTSHSQSLSNLTTIPQGGLSSSASVTSLSSNVSGQSRKKRAPPPPPAQNATPLVSELKMKSSTLPKDSKTPDPPQPVVLDPSPTTSPELNSSSPSFHNEHANYSGKPQANANHSPFPLTNLKRVLYKRKQKISLPPSPSTEGESENEDVIRTSVKRTKILPGSVKVLPRVHTSRCKRLKRSSTPAPSWDRTRSPDIIGLINRLDLKFMPEENKVMSSSLTGIEPFHDSHLILRTGNAEVANSELTMSQNNPSTTLSTSNPSVSYDSVRSPGTNMFKPKPRGRLRKQRKWKSLSSELISKDYSMQTKRSSISGLSSNTMGLTNTSYDTALLSSTDIDLGNDMDTATNEKKLYVKEFMPVCGIVDGNLLISYNQSKTFEMLKIEDMPPDNVATGQIDSTSEEKENISTADNFEQDKIKEYRSLYIDNADVAGILDKVDKSTMTYVENDLAVIENKIIDRPTLSIEVKFSTVDDKGNNGMGKIRTSTIVEDSAKKYFEVTFKSNERVSESDKNTTTNESMESSISQTTDSDYMLVSDNEELRNGATAPGTYTAELRGECIELTGENFRTPMKYEVLCPVLATTQVFSRNDSFDSAVNSEPEPQTGNSSLHFTEECNDSDDVQLSPETFNPLDPSQQEMVTVADNLAVSFSNSSLTSAKSLQDVATQVEITHVSPKNEETVEELAKKVDELVHYFNTKDNQLDNCLVCKVKYSTNGDLGNHSTANPACTSTSSLSSVPGHNSTLIMSAIDRLRKRFLIPDVNESGETSSNEIENDIVFSEVPSKMLFNKGSCSTESETRNCLSAVEQRASLQGALLVTGEQMIENDEKTSCRGLNGVTEILSVPELTTSVDALSNSLQTNSFPVPRKRVSIPSKTNSSFKIPATVDDDNLINIILSPESANDNRENVKSASRKENEPSPDGIAEEKSSIDPSLQESLDLKPFQFCTEETCLSFILSSSAITQVDPLNAEVPSTTEESFSSSFPESEDKQEECSHCVKESEPSFLVERSPILRPTLKENEGLKPSVLKNFRPDYVMYENMSLRAGVKDLLPIRSKHENFQTSVVDDSLPEPESKENKYPISYAMHEDLLRPVLLKTVNSRAFVHPVQPLLGSPKPVSEGNAALQPNKRDLSISVASPADKFLAGFNGTKSYEPNNIAGLIGVATSVQHNDLVYSDLEPQTDKNKPEKTPSFDISSLPSPVVGNGAIHRDSNGMQDDETKPQGDLTSDSVFYGTRRRSKFFPYKLSSSLKRCENENSEKNGSNSSRVFLGKVVNIFAQTHTKQPTNVKDQHLTSVNSLPTLKATRSAARTRRVAMFHSEELTQADTVDQKLLSTGASEPSSVITLPAPQIDHALSTSHAWKGEESSEAHIEIPFSAERSVNLEKQSGTNESSSISTEAKNIDQSPPADGLKNANIHKSHYLEPENAEWVIRLHGTAKGKDTDPPQGSNQQSTELLGAHNCGLSSNSQLALSAVNESNHLRNELKSSSVLETLPESPIREELPFIESGNIIKPVPIKRTPTVTLKEPIAAPRSKLLTQAHSLGRKDIEKPIVSEKPRQVRTSLSTTFLANKNIAKRSKSASSYRSDSCEDGETLATERNESVADSNDRMADKNSKIDKDFEYVYIKVEQTTSLPNEEFCADNRDVGGDEYLACIESSSKDRDPYVSEDCKTSDTVKFVKQEACRKPPELGTIPKAFATEHDQTSDEATNYSHQEMPEFGTFRKNFFRNLTFPRTEPSAEEHDSLNVDWQYQLPPPPSHFRDVSPTATEYETVTVGSDAFLPRMESSKSPKLNGIHEEDMTAEESKTSIDDSGISSDRSISDAPDSTVADSVQKESKDIDDDTVVSCTGQMKEPKKISDYVQKADIYEKQKDSVIRIHPKTETSDLLVSSEIRKNGLIEGNEKKVLQSKNDVMLELTNVLAQQGIREKSQSYTNLSAPLEQKLKKSHTLSYSQSFMNAPLSNFKISNYDSDRRHTCTTDDFDDSFRKPGPVIKSNVIKRTESININKKNSIDPEILQQEFLQFLQEKKLVDAGVALEDLEVIRGILPTKAVAKETNIQQVGDHKVVSNVEPLENVATVKVVEIDEKVTEAWIPGSRKPSDPVVVQVLPKPSFKEPEKTVIKIDNSEPSALMPNATNTDMTKHPEAAATQIIMPGVPARRIAFQPPSITMGTWGERPKTTVLIKDSDYTTQVDMVEKRPQIRTQTEESPKKNIEKKSVITLKKPTNYELFSALPKKKDALIMAAIQNEEEIVKKEAVKLPVVCAVELKKEFRSEPDLIQGLKIDRTSAESDVKAARTTSIYLNGYSKPNNNDVPTQPKVYPTKARPNFMPVVKGFRENVPYASEGIKSNSFKRQESLPAPVNRSIVSIPRQDSLPSKLGEPLRSNGIPPPPPIGSIMLKPVSSRQIKPKKIDEDPRGQLLEQIRGFGGLNRLKKTVE